MSYKQALTRLTEQQLQMIDEASKETLQTRSQFIAKSSIDRARSILAEAKNG